MDHSMMDHASSGFMPHGSCYAWTPGILWMEVFANTVIALSYFAIPVAMFYFIGKRKDLPHQHIFLLFGCFITFCGVGHLIDTVTIWVPIYWLKGSVDFATGLVSIGTAAALWPLLPRLLRAGTIEEVLQRRTVEALSDQKRALEETNGRLEESNRMLNDQMAEMRRATALFAERESRIEELRRENERLKARPDAPLA
jgi:hypothetical protein